jgi:hypothetical protein
MNKGTKINATGQTSKSMSAGTEHTAVTNTFTKILSTFAAVIQESANPVVWFERLEGLCAKEEKGSPEGFCTDVLMDAPVFMKMEIDLSTF